MKFLKHHHYQQALLQLERDSGTNYDRYSKQIEFFRRILIEGNFHEAISFIMAFENKLSERDYRRMMLEIFKQRLFELVENPNQEELRELLEKDIVNYCSYEQYQSLFYFLTLKNVRENPSFQAWTPILGRINCFEFIRPYIEIIDHSTAGTNQRKDEHIQLEDIVRFYFDRNPRAKEEYIESDSKKPSGTNDISLHSAIKLKGKYKYIEKLNLNEQLLQQKQTMEQHPRQPVNYRVESQRNIVSVGRQNLLVRNKEQHTSKTSNKQNDSIVYPPENFNDNFTFSQAQQPNKSPNKITEFIVKKVAYCTDPKAIRVAKFNPKGGMLALGTLSSSLKLYNVAGLLDQQPRRPMQLDPSYEVLDIHQKSVFFLDWSNKEDTIVTCSNDQTIKITKFEKGFKRHTSIIIGRHDAPVRMVKFDYSDTMVVSCSEDSTVRLWDVEKAKCTKVLKGHSYTVNAVRWAENQRNNLVVSVGKDYTIRLWDSRSGQCSIKSQQFPSQIMYIADQGLEYCVSHKNGTISMVDRYLRIRSNLELHSQEVRSVEYSNALNRYASASFDGQICLFDEAGQSTTYFIHNEQDESDNVVYVGLHVDGPLVSCSRMGLCNIYLVS